MGGLATFLRALSKSFLLCTLNKRPASLLVGGAGCGLASSLLELPELLSLSPSRRDRNDDDMFAVSGHFNQLKMLLSTIIASIYHGHQLDSEGRALSRGSYRAGF